MTREVATGHSVDVDVDVWELLRRNAEPFVDTPNSVLRRLLGIDGGIDRSTPVASRSPERAIASRAPTEVKSSQAKMRPSTRKKAPKQKVVRARVPSGSLLPEEEYEEPFIEALRELGGSAPSRDVINRLGEKLGPKLTELDLETLASGSVRWENRVQFVRLRLIDKGVLKKNSPRGQWELADSGSVA